MRWTEDKTSSFTFLGEETEKAPKRGAFSVSTLKNFPSFLKRCFAIDPRSLAAFRIAIACILLVDLFLRSQSLVAHYTDAGILPRSLALELFPDSAFWSIHFINGSLFFQSFLFLAAAFSAVCLLVGYKTRLAAFFCWLLLVSLHARNRLVFQGGDMLLGLLMFWSLFLPLGKQHSIDAKRNLASKTALIPPIYSVASFAILAQLIMMYVFAALHKSGEQWHVQLDAITYALQLEEMVRPAANTLLSFPKLLPAFTQSTLWLELYGPFFAFFPWKNNIFRTLTAFTFIGFHLGLALVFDVGLFSFVSAAAWLLFLPAGFWDKILRTKKRTENSKPHLEPIGQIKEQTPKALNGKKSPLKILKNLTILGLVIYVFLWNLRTLSPEHYQKIFPHYLDGIGKALRIEQLWRMFAPNVPKTSIGWQALAKTQKEETIDLMRNGMRVDATTNDSIKNPFHNLRWRDATNSLLNKWYAPVRKTYSEYLCKRWNQSHNPVDQIETIIFYVLEREHLPTLEPAPIKKQAWFEYRCE